MPAKPVLPGPRTLGRYALHGELASGGMAVVHFGRLLGPVGFSRTVAIKRLHTHFAKDGSFRAMFLDEARLAARVRHPNVVPILDVVDQSDDLYLVMEYVHGESLDRLMKGALRSGGGVPVPIAVAVVRDVLYGLHAAHEATSVRGTPLGIVHRDVSPHNVLVGVDGVGRVHDFGVAKAQSRLQLTSEGQLKGKIAYMAPEQVEQTGVDRRADVWAASVVLWEALTGKRLFTGEHPAQIMKAVLGIRIPPPREVGCELPEALESLVMRGLERDRDQRFASAQELAVALDATGVAAPQHTVGTWVEQVAKKALAQRARILAEIEGAATATAAPMIRPDVAADPSATLDTETRVANTLVTTSLTNAETQALSRPEARGDRPRWLPLAIVAVLAASGGAAVVAVFKSGAQPATSASAPQAEPIAATVPPPEPAKSAVVLAHEQMLDASAPRAPTRKPAATRRTAPAKPRSSCDPPWTTDADGVRIPKLHCLK